MSSIYIHIPFCHRKCIYCGFYSIAQKYDKDLYVNTLIKELNLRKNHLGKNIDTVYFGGGTPSLLNVKQIEKILTAIHKIYNVNSRAEITIEANAENCQKNYLKDLKNLGFNRLSIGIESFNDKELKFLNRSHTSNEAKNAIENAKQAEFPNISIDLICNIPNSTIESWQKNLETFLEYNLQHISCYNLMIEENTMLEKMLKKGKFSLISEDLALEQFDLTMQILETHSYIHYETSSYALKGFQSRHNTAYWTFKNYLGIGASAHSYYNNQRVWNEDNIELYINRINNSKTETLYRKENLNIKDNYNEYIMLALRMPKAINPIFVKENFPNQYPIFSKKLQEQINKGLLNKDLSFTKKGWHLQDEIILELAQ